MEVYYKDLISEEASLEKLVDDLMRVVQGATEFADAAGLNLPPQPRAELTTRREHLRQSCRTLKEQVVASARATDRLMRRYPYSAVGFGFSVGLLIGALIKRS